ncbi:MAG: hypothetical protein F6J90_35815 [Moorea sp. SIOASIH]|nr:hypothetical protein [Moorena sp. SIOASIH]NEO89677.1 hypothetical protein [Moorena sp. SIO3G5]
MLRNLTLLKPCLDELPRCMAFCSLFPCPKFPGVNSQLELCPTTYQLPITREGI